MSNWRGPTFRGAMRQHRAIKRTRAEQRNTLTRHEDRRSHREGRCGCEQRQAACPWPGKVAYASPQEAAWAMGKHAKFKRWRQGLNAYPCPSGGHFHLGRWFNRAGAWMRAA